MKWLGWIVASVVGFAWLFFSQRNDAESGPTLASPECNLELQALRERIAELESEQTQTSPSSRQGFPPEKPAPSANRNTADAKKQFLGIVQGVVRAPHPLSEKGIPLSLWSVSNRTRLETEVGPDGHFQFFVPAGDYRLFIPLRYSFIGTNLSMEGAEPFPVQTGVVCERNIDLPYSIVFVEFRDAASGALFTDWKPEILPSFRSIPLTDSFPTDRLIDGICQLGLPDGEYIVDDFYYSANSLRGLSHLNVQNGRTQGPILVERYARIRIVVLDSRGEFFWNTIGFRDFSPEELEAFLEIPAEERSGPTPLGQGEFPRREGPRTIQIFDMKQDPPRLLAEKQVVVPKTGFVDLEFTVP